MLKKALLLLTLTLPLAAFHVAELNINNKDFEGSLLFDLGQFNETLTPDSTYFGFSYIKGSEDHSDLKETEGLVGASFLLTRPFGPHENLSLGMGVRYLYTKIHEESFAAIPIGMHLSYNIPTGTSIPMYVGGHFYYSPEVLSFSKAKNYIEYRAFGGMELIERGHVIVGYRHIETNFERVDIEYNRSWFLGFRFQF